MYHFETKENLIAWIVKEIVGTAEATEIIGCSRQNMHKFVKTDKLVPIKEAGSERLFLLEDVLRRKEEASKYNRTDKRGDRE